MRSTKPTKYKYLTEVNMNSMKIVQVRKKASHKLVQKDCNVINDNIQKFRCKKHQKSKT